MKLENDLNIKYQVRPIRIAFIVEENENSSKIIDSIFHYSYSIWGGKSTLIVPIEKSYIEDNYLDWMKQYEPDIVYSYIKLNEKLKSIITEYCNPALIVEHKSENSNFVPDNIPKSVRSTSYFPKFNHYRAIKEKSSYLLSSINSESDDEFVKDNFGYVGNQQSFLKCNRLYVTKPDKRPPNYNFRDPEDKIMDVYEFLNRINKHDNLYWLAEFSFLDSHSQVHSNYKWRSRLHIFIGDSFKDRIYFWNSRNLFKEYVDSYYIPSLRIPSRYINDDKFFESFSKFLRTFNYYLSFGDTGNVVVLQSYSLLKKEIESFKDNLSKYFKPDKILIENTPPEISEFDDFSRYYHREYKTSQRINETP